MDLPFPARSFLFVVHERIEEMKRREIGLDNAIGSNQIEWRKRREENCPSFSFLFVFVIFLLAESHFIMQWVIHKQAKENVIL